MIRALADVPPQHPWFFPAVVFVFGACIGSFLNVVIYRVPAGKSIVRPGSACACGAPIAWHDNIPVLSWLILRGRARCCGRPFSARYPFVELLTGALFLACWLRLPPAAAVCGWVFLGSLVCGTFIDLDHMIIPDAFTIGLAVEGLLLSALVPALHGQHGGIFALDSLRSGLGRAGRAGGRLGRRALDRARRRGRAQEGGDGLRRREVRRGDRRLLRVARRPLLGLRGRRRRDRLARGRAALAEGRRQAGLRARPGPRRPDGQPADIGLGVHVPFGPMLAIAGGALLPLPAGLGRRLVRESSRPFCDEGGPVAPCGRG
jgi:leader peptidase (prepilin peptidase) / N-methyltransferase